jgi:hypothetical protein
MDKLAARHHAVGEAWLSALRSEPCGDGIERGSVDGECFYWHAGKPSLLARVSC